MKTKTKTNDDNLHSANCCTWQRPTPSIEPTQGHTGSYRCDDSTMTKGHARPATAELHELATNGCHTNTATPRQATGATHCHTDRACKPTMDDGTGTNAGRRVKIAPEEQLP